MSTTITAFYNGKCTWCDGRIHADLDEIRVVEGTGWLHEDCADECEGSGGEEEPPVVQASKFGGADAPIRARAPRVFR
jgi:hypothetical protein